MDTADMPTSGLSPRTAHCSSRRTTAAVWNVLPLLLSQPAVTSAVLQQVTGLSQPAADNVLRQLRDAGIVSKASGAQRHIVWVANDVTQALDAFAERARRR